MIPKIIHYCWISGDAFPEKIQMCYDSWKKVLPDYEIVVWDYEKVHALNVRWCEEAMACKKYAFVADYVRFYALYNYGGIYLDSDVEVLKSFDDLLNLMYFVGKENSGHGWEAAILGAEKGMFWVKTCLDYYKDRAFINAFGEMQMHILPAVMNKRINECYQVKICDTIADWEWNEQLVCRFPVDWFSPKHYDTLELNVTKNTYSIHHFSASWKAIQPVSVKLTLSQKVLGVLKRIGSFIKHRILHIKKPLRKR